MYDDATSLYGAQNSPWDRTVFQFGVSQGVEGTHCAKSDSWAGARDRMLTPALMSSNVAAHFETPSVLDLRAGLATNNSMEPQWFYRPFVQK